MIKMRPYVCPNRLAVRDSLEEDLSEDIEDEVFIKDSSRSSKRNEERGLKRPLMNGRRSSSTFNELLSMHNSRYLFRKSRRSCNRCSEHIRYAFAIFAVFVAGLSLILFFLSISPMYQRRYLGNWWFSTPTETESQHNKHKEETIPIANSSIVIPCSQISVQKIWSRVFPLLNSESPLRKADLNADKVLDIIFGFGVDNQVQSKGYPLPKCKSPLFDDEVLCEGGVVAVNGRNGELLWETWSVSNVFSLLCSWDINQDGYTDCIAAGKLGMIFAINGRNGNNIWEFKELQVESNSVLLMDLYTINMVRDLDDDGIAEVLAVHFEEHEQYRAGHIKLISGRTGKTIRSIPTPYREETFVPIQLITTQDGTEVLLMVTGGQNSPGGIYSLRLMSMMKFTNTNDFAILHRRNHSGFMVPTVLTDLTGDGMIDIVVAAFNSTVMAFDGRSFNMIWNYTFPTSNSVSAIVPGHFNEDNITDFMIKYNSGPGFPIYYYSQTMILDGSNGKPLLNDVIMDSGGASSLLGGISISQNHGGDLFLHWQMQCNQHMNERHIYEFFPDSDIIQQARADSCRLRYNSSSILKLYATAEHIKIPGAVLFSTEDLDVHLNCSKQMKSTGPSDWNKTRIREEQWNKIHAKEEGDSLARAGDGLDRIITKDKLLLLNNSYELKRSRNNPFYDGIISEDNAPVKDTSQDYENAVNPSRLLNDNYDSNYLDDEVLQLVPFNQRRPIHLRSKYPARDVRRSNSNVDTISSKSRRKVYRKMEARGTTINENKAVHPINLWDLEQEQEERDAINDNRRYRGKIPLSEQDSSTQQLLDNELLEKRSSRNKQKMIIEELSQSDSSSGSGGGSSSNCDGQQYDGFLASISSTGVLLESLHHLNASIDFAFTLNVRQSEIYPPLYLPQDENCVEEKLNAYRSDTTENQQDLRRQFLKECLNERIVPRQQTGSYESQLILTRLGITCTCRSLQPNETCSQLEPIEKQRWAQYMGNAANGVY